MSALEITKVISVRMPGIYFRRLGFLAYHQGKLPSEAARGILKWYLDMGCLTCGGPVTDIDDEAPRESVSIQNADHSQGALCPWWSTIQMIHWSPNYQDSRNN